MKTTRIPVKQSQWAMLLLLQRRGLLVLLWRRSRLRHPSHCRKQRHIRRKRTPIPSCRRLRPKEWALHHPEHRLSCLRRCQKRRLPRLVYRLHPFQLAELDAWEAICLAGQEPFVLELHCRVGCWRLARSAKMMRFLWRVRLLD